MPRAVGAAARAAYRRGNVPGLRGGGATGSTTSEEFAAQINSEMAKWARIIEQPGPERIDVDWGSWLRTSIGHTAERQFLALLFCCLSVSFQHN